jgi:DNA polymerase-3 subunit alpha
LKEHSEGLIVLTVCLAVPISGPLLRDDFEEARDNLETLIDCVGKENVYLEIMDHGIDAESDILDDIVELSKEYGIPMVATNDSHYTLIVMGTLTTVSSGLAPTRISDLDPVPLQWFRLSSQV